MKYKTARLPIEQFFGLKSKMYFFLVDNFSGHKNAKDVNKNYAAKKYVKKY